MWHDDYYDDDGNCWVTGDDMINFLIRKAHKAKIKEELMPIAWHPSRWRNWCMSEDEKKQTEKLWK